MKHLSKVVNIIPVIAKADTMTLEEKTEFKQRVSNSSPAWDTSLPGLEVGEMSCILLPTTAELSPGHALSPTLGWCVSPEDAAAYGSEGIC